MTIAALSYGRQTAQPRHLGSGAEWRRLRKIVSLPRPKAAGEKSSRIRVASIGRSPLQSTYARRFEATALRKWKRSRVSFIPACVVAAQPQRWQAFPHAAMASRGTFDEKTLADPKELLKALTALNLSNDDRRTLVLFAEALRFDVEQRGLLQDHLWEYLIEHRSSDDEATLVAVGAAMRKLIAYWPAARLDQLRALVEIAEGSAPARITEMEFTKGLVYRFTWDADVETTQAPALCDLLFELAGFHSSRRALVDPTSAGIAMNAILALAFMHDERILEFARLLPVRSLPWFAALVQSRVVRHIAQAQQVGRLPGILPALAEVMAEHTRH